MSDALLASIDAARQVLGWKGELETTAPTRMGSSGASVVFVRSVATGQRCTIKCARKCRVALVDEVSRREWLSPHLSKHLPNILWCGVLREHEILIVECPATDTLHRAISDWLLPRDALNSIWVEIVQALVCLWLCTKTHYEPLLCTRHFPRRLERIRSGLRAFSFQNLRLADAYDTQIIIDGHEYPSIAETLDFVSAAGWPAFGVTCHGDPQPSNILVSREQNWFLVDWEWSGPNHDWRMMLSHMYGWWVTQFGYLLSEPKMLFSGGRLYLEYDVHVPAHVADFQAATLRAFISEKDSVAEHNNATDVNRFLIALYLGEVRFLRAIGRELLAPVLIGEAVKLAAEFLSGNPKPRLKPFGFEIPPSQ